MLDAGTLIAGSYRILRLTGQGGTAKIYLARHERTGRLLAIKKIETAEAGLQQNLSAVPAMSQTSAAEIRMLQTLRHRMLPAVIDILEWEGGSLLIMEYIEGKSLKQLLTDTIRETGQALEVDCVLNWAEEICSLLIYLHSRRPPVIYGDLKPENLMLDGEGKLRIIDLGSAFELNTESRDRLFCTGTPGYAAPEQYGCAGDCEPCTDLYAFGMTLYELLTGELPKNPDAFEGSSGTVQLNLKKGTAKQDCAELSGLETVLSNCIQKEKEKRYQSAEELKEELNRIRFAGSSFSKRKRIQKGSCMLSAVLAVVLFLLAGLFEQGAAGAKENGYALYMDLSSRGTREEREGYLNRAAALFPERADPYVRILSVDLENGFFSSGEEKKFLQLLMTVREGRKEARMLLKQDPKSWCRVCYELGIAYYYFYEGTGDRSAAESWFYQAGTAAAACGKMKDGHLVFEEEQTEKKVMHRAEIYEKLCRFYNARLGEIEEKQEISYGDHWEELCALIDSDLTEADSEAVQLALYLELAELVRLHTAFLSEDGITIAEMESRCGQIAKEAKMIPAKAGSALETRKNLLMETLRQAEESIKTEKPAARPDQ